LSQKHFYEFGPYRLDVALSRVERGADIVAIPPKAFDLLVLLARNSDRILSKNELMESLWPNTFVEEANLTQHIYTLRKALGDRPGGEPYIEMIPRRGYRLAGGVRELRADRTGGPPTTASMPAVPPSPHREGAPAAPEGERKRATVLRCAIANPGAVAERLGAAAMHELTRRLVQLAEGAIGRLEGAISERHADGFVAVFGAPVVHEDDARRAVLAAFEVEQHVPQLVAAGSPNEERVEVKFGINTGPLVISRRGDEPNVEYIAVGETMRIADLLLQFAAPGAILIGEATRRAGERYLRVEPAAAAPGITAYRVVGMSKEAAGLTREQRGLAPFLGREREVGLLDGLLRQASRKGQVVSIVGEPGMGKSRLVYEFAAAAASRQESPLVLEGRCVSYGSLVPYLPLTELLRSHCGLDETDPPEIARAAIDHVVRQNELPETARALLCRLLGVADDATTLQSLTPEALKARTFDVLRLLFLKVAARRPLVVVVEDVHWIDRTSEEFLSTLVTALAGARVLLIETHRPGYHAPWMDRSYVTQITLAPLSVTDSAELVEWIAGEQPLAPEVSAAILDRGEGNPFFLEELARSMVEHGPALDAIPGTVQGVIMARLDRLPEASKQLLQTASILGREAPLRVLARVWEGGADFERELKELCRLEFLYESPGGDDASFVFKHALTQDVAYDSLLARRRRDLHLRAARALEELYADRLDEIAATLAFHYARTDLVDEAVTWLMRAADQAARVYANAEAILHLDLAARRVQRLPEGPDRDRRMLEVALRHAHSLYFLGRFRESVDVLLPHEARLARLGDAALTAAYAFWLAHMYSRLGDQRRAADSAHRAIDAATTARDEATLGKAHGLLALEGHWAGKPREGIAHGTKAVCLLTDLVEQRWWLGMAHFYIAVNHLLAGDFNAALTEAARADAIGKAMGDPRLQAYAGYTTGWIQASRHHHEAALAACRNSLEQAPDRVSRAYASMFLGYALVEHEAAQEARTVLEPTVAELEGFGFLQWHGLALTLMAEVCRLQAQPEEALTFVERGLQVAERAEYWYAVGVARRVAGRIARDRGRADDASSAFDSALATFERIGAMFEAARTRVEIAEISHQLGDSRRARRELTAAYRTFQLLKEDVYRDRAVELAEELGVKGFPGSSPPKRDGHA
jgi:DNA-binding winged helix-turn-helix (wHTH) protein/tetratricopeptide (TPR) repeat protein